MGQQPGLFDVDARLQELSAKGDALERLTGLVDFALTWNWLCRDQMDRKAVGRHSTMF